LALLNTVRADRQAAVEWARGLMADTSSWVCLDTETTGIEPSSAIVQIGVVAPDGGVLLDCLINPGVNIPQGAREIHGIGDDHVRLAANFSAAYSMLRAVVGSRTVVIYNVAYDRGIITNALKRYGLPPLGVSDWQCAMLRYSEYRGIPNNGRNRANQTPYLWHRLPALDQSKAHGAVADCLSTLAIIRKMGGE
jgi:DNA polymerase-3 subunit epsilon